MLMFNFMLSLDDVREVELLYFDVTSMYHNHKACSSRVSFFSMQMYHPCPLLVNDKPAFLKERVNAVFFCFPSILFFLTCFVAFENVFLFFFPVV